MHVENLVTACIYRMLCALGTCVIIARPEGKSGRGVDRVETRYGSVPSWEIRKKSVRSWLRVTESWSPGLLGCAG